MSLDLGSLYSAERLRKFLAWGGVGIFLRIGCPKLSPGGVIVSPGHWTGGKETRLDRSGNPVLGMGHPAREASQAS